MSNYHHLNKIIAVRGPTHSGCQPQVFFTMSQCHKVCHGAGGDLSAHRELIERLYVEQDESVRTVANRLLQDHRLVISETFLKKKIRTWQIRKRKAGSRAPGLDNTIKKNEPVAVGKSRRGKGPLEVEDSISNSRREALRLAVNRQTLDSVSPPDTLGLAEGMLRACHHYSAVQLKSWAAAVSQDHELINIARETSLSFRLAIDESIGTQDVVRRGALLEQGFRGLDSIIRHERHESHALFYAVLLIMTRMRVSKAPPALQQMLLRHLAAATSISFRPYHPAAVFARNLLILPVSMELLEVLVRAFLDAHSEALGAYDAYTRLMSDQFQHLIFAGKRDSMSPDEIIEWYINFIALDAGRPGELYYSTIKHEGYAKALMSYDRWDEAVELLEPAPDHAQMNIDWRAAGGDVHVGTTTPPVSLMNSLTRMLLLARALVGQGKTLLAGRPLREVPAVQEKFGKAQNLCRSAISMSIVHLGDQHQETSELREGFAHLLKDIGLEEDARAVTDEMNETLADFVLNPTPEPDESTDDSTTNATNSPFVISPSMTSPSMISPS